MILLFIVAAFVLWMYLVHWTRRWPRLQVSVVLMPIWIPFAALFAAMIPEWIS